MSKIKMFSLGGLDENGKNMFIIEINDGIFIFEAGLKYADEMTLGIDYIIPNITYLKENKKRIKGIFISDHQRSLRYPHRKARCAGPSAPSQHAGEHAEFRSRTFLARAGYKPHRARAGAEALRDRRDAQASARNA